MYPASKYVFLTLLIIIISKIKSNECAISRNSSSIHPRANDAYQSSSSSIDRQFPGDVYGNFIPQIFIGIIIPIAIIIGVGIILIKLFIIGYWVLGRGGYGLGGYGGFGGGYGGGGYGQGGYYPWRADHHQQTARSLLNKDGSVVPPFLSSTILSLIEIVSNALEKYEKEN